VNQKRIIAYFSMEIGLEPGMRTYAGGLGILAGDTIRAAADLKAPIVGITLLHRKGYFRQSIDLTGWQKEEPEPWPIDRFLKEMPQRTSVAIEGRTVYLRSWRYEATGVGGFKVPVYFLDSDLPENSEWDRSLSHFLYGGDQRYRLCQEVILGIGGVRILRVLGYDEIQKFHMNEGHSSLLAIELLDETAREVGRDNITRDDIESVREKCIFTTHTPVASGHDQFPPELVSRVLGRQEFLEMKDVFCCEGRVNMTYVALNLSGFVNGVAKSHREISQLKFGAYSIDSITNGVHIDTWLTKPFRELYDHHIPGWKQDNFTLRYALSIPKNEIWEAHTRSKEMLIDFVNQQTGLEMKHDVLTLGFARRATEYKRWNLIFQDTERLKRIASQNGGLQIVYSGKAHPQDHAGKEAIQNVLRLRESLKPNLKLAYLTNYDMELARLMVAGVDLWLNTPLAPFEASGTSGMKAAANGVPSLSVLDGWWVEGCIEGVTGWAIGNYPARPTEGQPGSSDADSLYEKLEHVIIPLYYRERERFLEVMLHAIALNGSFFNTHRMIQQYVLDAYFR
jgi:starch phosphorylase